MRHLKKLHVVNTNLRKYHKGKMKELVEQTEK